MRKVAVLLVGGVFALTVGAVHAQAPGSQDQKPTIEELLHRIDMLQHRVDELEGRAGHPKSTIAHHSTSAPASVKEAGPAPIAPVAQPVGSSPPVAGVAPVVYLRPPEPMGHQFEGEGEDALRSDLPGLSWRVPGSQSEVRFYGFANVNGYRDFNARNQTDAPPAQTIPLANSPAAMQGGDFGMSARFSRFGMDTRTPTGWGTFETRLEGDFGGGAPVSANALFRLRQAWAEVGTEQFRVLVGQANSLWNEGIFETVNFATNLNQSFVRQPQVRATGTLAPGLTGQVSLEMPDTQFTSTAGVFTQITTPAGFPGLSPAFTSLPDLLGRLTYNNDGLVLDLRGLLRDLSIHTAGTAAAPPAFTDNAPGWGVAGMARIPMRWLLPVFGPDEVVAMAYVGEGIGRYMSSNTFGLDAVSNLGLPGVTLASLDPVTSYGASAAYRRFWTPQLRSTFAVSYARQNYPTYALLFTPGTVGTTSMNSNIEQAIVNLIWSPFAELRGNTVGTGWLDVGLEYVYTHRDVLGGSAATAGAGTGEGTANRVLASATLRF